MPLERQPASPPPPPALTTLRLGWIRLTLDDVQDLLDLAERSGYPATLTAGWAVATDAESLRSATRAELRQTRISIPVLGVEVNLQKSAATVRYPTTSPDAEKLGRDLASLLRRRKVWPPLFLLREVAKGTVLAVALILIFVGITAITSPANLATAGPRLLASPGVLVILFCGALLGTATFLGANSVGTTSIATHFRHEQRVATLTARATTVIAVVSAVASAAVSSLLTWLITK